MIVYRDFWFLLVFWGLIGIPIFLLSFFAALRLKRFPLWALAAILLSIPLLLPLWGFIFPFLFYVPVGAAFGLGARKQWRPYIIISLTSIYLFILCWLFFEFSGAGFIITSPRPVVFIDHLPNAFLAEIWESLKGFTAGQEALKLQLNALFGITDKLKTGFPAFTAFACFALVTVIYYLFSFKYLCPLPAVETWKPGKLHVIPALFAASLGFLCNQALAVNAAIFLSWGLSFFGMGAIVFWAERLKPGIRRSAWVLLIFCFPFTPFRWLFGLTGIVDLVFDLRLPARVGKIPVPGARRS